MGFHWFVLGFCPGQSFSFSECSFGAGTSFFEPGIVVGGSVVYLRCGSVRLRAARLRLGYSARPRLPVRR
jgi:hypothetical protein